MMATRARVRRSYAQEQASDVVGILFFNVDRAARNLFDYAELERLGFDYRLKAV